MSEDQPVIVIDAMNAFCRAYAAYPTMSAHGYQMGGCIGFLKTLKRLVYEIQPSTVYVCWEGGGSKRRRSLLPEYKLNRVAGKLNRFYDDDIPESEENRNHQTLALLAMLKCTPVCQLYASDCEGDDLIAYLTCGPLRGREKVIVSSDKDLYQLLDASTRLYSLHKKAYVTPDSVLEEFRVQSQHFAIAKALCGDSGDNVPGIKGIGFKTVSKLFPMLGNDAHIVLQDVLNYAVAHAEESKLYQRIVEQQDVVKRNFRLVHLDGSMVPANQQYANNQRIIEFIPRMNRPGFIKLLVKEGVGDFDDQQFFSAFHCIDGLHTTRETT